MKLKTISVSVLETSQPSDSNLQKTLRSITDLRLMKGARDPETFLSLHEERPPDLVLVELNGKSAIPDWLERLVKRLPRSKLLVCSQSREPDFLIQVMKLRTGGFIPLPLQQEELQPILELIKAERAKQADKSQSQILAITGTKGGVGTTSVAVNLAVALAEILGGGGVVLVDLARPFPQVGQFLDLKSTHTFMDLAESPESLDSIFLQKVVQRYKSGLEVLLGQPFHHQASAELPNLPSLDKIFDVLRSSYNWIVVDLGISFDLLNVRMFQRADQILLVTELTVPDLQNLKKIRAIWPDWDLDETSMKVVVNRYIKDYSLGLKDLENVCFQPAFFTLPHDHEVLRDAVNQGMALGDLAPRSKIWRRIKELAAELLAECQQQPAKQAAARTGFFRRLLHKER